ncbi:MAG: c-type cytochrome [Acidobacteria bacterium]|nr:c-type cytochrome [Acidobacteriota bacterium]
MSRFLSYVAAAVLAGTVSFAGEKEVAYGKYLLEEVAKCQECHTPKTATGELDKGKWLKGATLDFQPVTPIERWHKTSPDITPTGRLWQRWGEKAVLEYLQTGLTPKGKPADPPMPAYKLKKVDAEAMLEYLKSLK